MPTPSVQVGPPLVNFTLFVPNTADVDFTFDALPAGTFTAALVAPNADDIDLDTDTAGDVVTVAFPDLSAYLNRTGNRLHLLLDGQVVIEGPVKLTAHGLGQATTAVNVTTLDAIPVAVTVAGVVSESALIAGLLALSPIDGGSPDSAGPDLVDGGAP